MKVITTGAFLIPLTNQSGGPNDALFILWKNPSDKSLTTYFLGERPVAPVTTAGVKPEVRHLFTVKIPAHSFFSLNAGNGAGFYVRWSFWGNIERNEPKDKLSVELIVGTLAPLGGTLSVADPTVFFRHEDMVKADIHPPRKPIPIPTDPTILSFFQQ